MKNLTDKAKEVRRILFKTICNGGGGHTPASLSIVEILTVLYFEILNVDPKNPRWPERDRFILSKGHAGVALYAVLAQKGFFDAELLNTFGKFGTILGGHPDMHKVPGVEASTGSLGHGFPFSVGVALAGKIDKASYRVFTVVGDGECQEGSVWEAAMFAPKHRLDNLVCIVDHNKLQAMDRLDNIVPLAPLAEKWKAFGWAVCEVDGHNVGQLKDVFSRRSIEPGKPALIIAHTVKGKGVSFMENVPIWHYRMPGPKELEIAAAELGLTLNNGVLQ